jgi:hypothetical protein
VEWILRLARPAWPTGLALWWGLDLASNKVRLVSMTSWEARVTVSGLAQGCVPLRQTGDDDRG